MVQEMNRPQDVLVLQNIAQDGPASHSNTSSVTLSTAFAAAQTATSGAMPIDLDGTYDTAVVAIGWKLPLLALASCPKAALQQLPQSSNRKLPQALLSHGKLMNR
jgi:hypothetical protein